MKRLEIKNNQINFIGIWDLENNELCKNIINFFEKNIDLQKDGATGDGKKNGPRLNRHLYMRSCVKPNCQGTGSLHRSGPRERAALLATPYVSQPPPTGKLRYKSIFPILAGREKRKF